ncbi:hypothetical protein [Streptomyces sp. NPDC059991]|uniref:hypothetical protein n=1 Tax=unclassified Streptomyces TaxID=2593676 RepID=UPI0036944D4A
MPTALAVGSLVLVARCSGGGGDGKSGTTPKTPDGAESAPAASQSKYTKFADFPGKDLVTTEPGMPLGVR